MTDEETWSLWDHISGEAFEGPLAGQKLEIWPISMTLVEAALAKMPDLRIYTSSYRSWKQWFMHLLHRKFINSKGFLPPHFYLTMSQPIDPRLPKLEQGLGVIEGDQAKFYPMKSLPKGEMITDSFAGRTIVLERSEIDGVPSAKWQAGVDGPMQLLSRWYGFSYSYPDCDIYLQYGITSRRKIA
jgi:hypothetical protein